MPGVLGITTERDFKNETSQRGTTKKLANKVFNPRGSYIKLIDSALHALDKVGHGGGNNAKLGAARAIAKACAYWLQQKHLKDSPVAVKRRPIVARVLEEALEGISYIDPAAGAYAKRKCAAIRTGRAVMPGGKPTKLSHLGGFQTQNSKGLDGTYQHERTWYVSHGKGTFSSAAGKIHEQLPLYADDQDWDTLSFMDYDTITDRIAKDSMGYAQYGRVQYMDKTARLQCLVLYENGIFAQPDGLPYSTVHTVSMGGNRIIDMWAMDRYGNLFIKRSEPSNTAAYFNHSTFCAGREVICAGMICIDNGVLVYIDNSSGHYKPDEDALNTALVHFRDEGGVTFGAQQVRVGIIGNGGQVTSYDGASVLDGNMTAWDNAWNGALGLTDVLMGE